eukprot:321935_1
MQIYIKRHTAKKTIQLDVEPTDTIQNIKAKIQESELAVPSPQQTLVFAGKCLKDDHKLSDYIDIIGLYKDSIPTLHLVVSCNDICPSITIPFIRIKTFLIKNSVNKLFTIDAKSCIYIAAVLDYLCLELTELAGNAPDSGDWLSDITPTDVARAINNDTEGTNRLFSDTLNQILSPIKNSKLPLIKLTASICSKIYYDCFYGLAQQGAVDLDALASGIKQLSININNKQIEQLWNIMSDSEEYVDDEQFYSFISCTNHVLNDELKRIKLIFIGGISEWYCNKYATNNKLWIELKRNRINMMYRNVENIIYRLRDVKPFESKLSLKTNEEVLVDENIININRLSADLFSFLLEYVHYDDIKDNIYTTCRLFHQRSILILNQKYSKYICCDWLIEPIRIMASQTHPEIEYVRKDSLILMNGLLTFMLFQIVDKINKNKNGNNITFLDAIQKTVQDITGEDYFEYIQKEANRAITFEIYDFKQSKQK